MTPVREPIWSFQFCSSDHPTQTELKHFPRRGRWCANGHWKNLSLHLSHPVSRCTVGIQHLARPAQWHGGGGRWGSAGISTLSFPELNPSEVGGAKSNCCRHFCWMGAALRGEGTGPWGVGTCRGPCKSSTGSGFMCFLVALGTALDLISAEPTFAEPFVNHLTPAQTCWEHQSHLPDHNVPSFSFFPSFLSLLLQPTYIIWAWQGGKR